MWDAKVWSLHAFIWFHGDGVRHDDEICFLWDGCGDDLQKRDPNPEGEVQQK